MTLWSIHNEILNQNLIVHYQLWRSNILETLTQNTEFLNFVRPEADRLPVCGGANRAERGTAIRERRGLAREAEILSVPPLRRSSSGPSLEIPDHARFTQLRKKRLATSFFVCANIVPRLQISRTTFR